MKVEELDCLSISSDDEPLKVKQYNGSDDDDDDVPLINVKADNKVKKDSFSNLYEDSWDKCEFCDAICRNKYNLLVHTAKHIIIPLLKQELFQCSECLFHFKSPLDLRVHAFRKHSNTIAPVNNVGSVKTEPAVQNHHTPPKEVKTQNILESIVKRESLVKCNDLDLTSHNSSSTGLKNRLVFEEELEHENLLNDFTTECKVNIEKFGSPWLDHRVTPEPKMDVAPRLLKQVYESVHYDELMKVGTYVCKICQQTFLNRYELVIHETDHLKIKKGQRRRLPPLCHYCERFIAGNYKSLQQHMDTKHTTAPPREFTCHNCRKCGLRYVNFYKHVVNYHQIYKCWRCGKGFEFDQERMKHVQECQNLDWDAMKNGLWDSRIVKLCDLCFSFTRNKQNSQFVAMGEWSEVGKRQPCDHCGNAFFELKLVKAWHLLRFHKGEKRKSVSCQDRLMKRIKMLKKK